MELKSLIEKLIESEIIENQELGLTLLASPEITDEEKRTHIDKFVKDYLNGKTDVFSEHQKNVLKMWIDIYLTLQEGEVKNRVKKIKS